MYEPQNDHREYEIDSREILLARIQNQYLGYFCCIFDVTLYFFFQTSL